jgi:homopolymeric O-antigen transport system permease protein
MNFPLLLHFVRQDLVDRHAASALGAVWTLLVPLSNILIFTLVFSRIMGMRLESMGMEYLGNYSYSVYLVTGLLAWICFQSTLTRITQVYHEKAGLITKVRVSLFTLPLYVIISETIIYLISLSFFVIFLMLIDFNWSYHWLWLPVIFLAQQLLAFGLGLICAILSVFLRDVKEIVNVATQFWFWMTPIVYVFSIIPEQWSFMFLLNPIYHTTKAFRDTLILGQNPDLTGLLVVFALGGALTLLGMLLGRYLERDIRDFL